MKIRNQIFACLLGLSVLWGAMSNYLIMFSFQLNSNYIAHTLCVNKDKPNSDCCGKCYLKKELEQNNNSDQQNTKSVPLKLTTLNWISMQVLPYHYIASEHTAFRAEPFSLYHFSFHQEGFTPPWQA